MEITASAPLWLIVGILLGGFVEFTVSEYRAYKESRGIALALAAELGALRQLVTWRQYLALLDERITNLQNTDRKMQIEDIFSVRITQKYFTVFESACAKIGVLDELSASVVETYALIKAMLEDIDQLNVLYQAAIKNEVESAVAVSPLEARIPGNPAGNPAPRSLRPYRSPGPAAHMLSAWPSGQCRALPAAHI